MPWAKIDDQFHSHRKAKIAWKAHRAALGLHMLALSYCAGQMTDGLVDDEFVEEKMPFTKDRAGATDALILAGLWTRAEDGWQINDFLEYNPSRAYIEREREWDRRRKELFRDPELVAAIRDRDRNRCRYCGALVNWKDRRGPTGGTYDHVIPRGPNSLENVVVACRRCNNSKGARTPEEAAMPLLTPGRLGARSEPDRSQIESSGEARSDQDTRPDPTRPDPIIPPYPPPSGGRKRDRVEWEESALSWARSLGYTADDMTLLRAIRQAEPWAQNGGAAEHFAEFVNVHFGGVA